MVEALADGVVTDQADVQRYLRLMCREIQHLSGLIDDLFEVSQIELGALRLERTPVDAGALVRDVVAAYQAPAATRGVALMVSVSGLSEVHLEGDAARLQRVLRNLLDNALRHTPTGGSVEVGTRVAGGELEVAVSDSGPGIPQHERERVFERFYRGEAARSRLGPHADGAAGDGAGLGLAIARGLVEAHHGRMWADASPLGGASIRLTLPLAGGGTSA